MKEIYDWLKSEWGRKSEKKRRGWGENRKRRVVGKNWNKKKKKEKGNEEEEEQCQIENQNSP